MVTELREHAFDLRIRMSPSAVTNAVTEILAGDRRRSQVLSTDPVTDVFAGRALLRMFCHHYVNLLGDSVSALQRRVSVFCHHIQRLTRIAETRAIRTKKARRTKGRCPHCRTTITVGQPIALLPGIGWTHSRCAIQMPHTGLTTEGGHMAAGDTQITIVGNLVEDPELRFTPNGQAVSRFRVASTPRYRDQQSGEWKDGDSLFLTVNVWRQAAENCAESLQRGMRVIVQGRLRQRSYETKAGEKRTSYEIEADEVGPSLKNAVAKVNKTQRQGGQTQQGGGFSGGPKKPADDPWATGGGGFSDDPPF